MHWFIFNDFKNEMGFFKIIMRYLSLKCWIRVISTYLIAFLFGGLFIFEAIGDKKIYILLLFLILMIITSSNGALFLRRSADNVVFSKYKINEKNAYSSVKFYEYKLSRLVYILRKYDINNKEKVGILIKRIEDEKEGLHFTKQLMKKIFLPFTSLISFVFIAIRVTGVDISFTMEVFALLITLVIVLFGVHLMVKPIAEDILNSDYNKAIRLKSMLHDILILDLYKSLEKEIIVKL